MIERKKPNPTINTTARSLSCATTPHAAHTTRVYPAVAAAAAVTRPPLLPQESAARRNPSHVYFSIDTTSFVNAKILEEAVPALPPSSLLSSWAFPVRPAGWWVVAWYIHTWCGAVGFACCVAGVLACGMGCHPSREGAKERRRRHRYTVVPNLMKQRLRGYTGLTTQRLARKLCFVCTCIHTGAVRHAAEAQHTV